jgi:hypothetical protein
VIFTKLVRRINLSGRPPHAARALTTVLARIVGLVTNPDQSKKTTLAKHEATEARLAADPLCEKEDSNEDEETTIRFVSKKQLPKNK